MSFSSREAAAGRLIRRRLATAGALLALGLAAVPAGAQEYYFQPRADIGVEYDTDRDLVTSGPKQSSEGYLAGGGATLGIATPTTDTTLRPQLNYSDYPVLSESALQELLDFNSVYSGQRSQAGIYGRFDHSDLFASELASATFNPLNPNLPTTPETGRISATGTRTLLTIVPSYQYALTPRLGVGVTGTYQDSNYGGSGSQYYISYQYYSGTAGLDWKLNNRSSISFGVIGSRETANNGSSSTDGHGVQASYDYAWSKTFTSTLTVVGQQDDIHNVVPVKFDTTSSGFGATYELSWKGQISQVLLSAGRTFTPNGAGGTFNCDQFQIEYHRDLTQRMTLVVAAHYIQNIAQSTVYAGSDYDYVTSTVDLKWQLTRTWYIRGGLEYLDENFSGPHTSTDNLTATISFGYEGLGKR
jgi:hypothetical protein